MILDEVTVANLGIQTVEAQEEVFESTVTVLGEIAHTCWGHSIVSSRIPGRIVEVGVHLGEFVKKDDLVARVESRQPGDPPPVVELRAPAPGLVVKSEIHLGAPVEPENPLLEVHDLSTVWVVARVPQHYGPMLVDGLMGRVSVAALGKDFSGKFLRLGVDQDATAGTLEAIFEIPDPKDSLRPGMRAEVSLIAERREGVFSIPREAIQGESPDRFVFIRDYELKHAFVRSPVVVGEISGARAEIILGLLPGDEVVTVGAYALAFAGRGNASLKEALDAAHGHPHNEDGTEMSAEQLGATASEHDGHGHGHSNDGFSGFTLFFAITSSVLLLLLLASPFVFRNRHTAKD